jgi:hypothetical protein
MPPEAAADRMGLSVARVMLLVEHERDRRDRQRFKRDSIPITWSQQIIAQELARDPELTHAEIAHRMNMHQADFEIQFGYSQTKDGNGKRQERVGIPQASRLMIALGRAPNELEGC